MQDLKVGEYYRISANEVNELIEEGKGEYSTGKFVKIADETGETNSDPAKNTYYLFEDVKSYTVNSTTPTEEEESELLNSVSDDNTPIVFKLLGTEENAKNEPFTIYAAWGALHSGETETAPEDEDEDQTAPTTSSTSSTTSSTSTTNNYEQQIQALEAHIAELQRQLNETQSLLRVPESERAALYAEMTSSSSNPQPEEDEPSKKPPQGGRKHKGKSVKRNRNKGRRVTYRLRRRA